MMIMIIMLLMTRCSLFFEAGFIFHGLITHLDAQTVDTVFNQKMVFLFFRDNPNLSQLLSLTTSLIYLK